MDCKFEMDLAYKLIIENEKYNFSHKWGMNLKQICLIHKSTRNDQIDITMVCKFEMDLTYKLIIENEQYNFSQNRNVNYKLIGILN